MVGLPIVLVLATK